ncbi:hypothetical protein [Stutzerimonas decontaminans]|uniref:hypothetical protein n=1 Tax=Stutzerimonas decontaminans TaxID=3022791 RepID=UPI0012D2D619|nr:hypothetical protein [Stutzerimonas decontaminans]
MMRLLQFNNRVALSPCNRQLITADIGAYMRIRAINKQAKRHNNQFLAELFV